MPTLRRFEVFLLNVLSKIIGRLITAVVQNGLQLTGVVAILVAPVQDILGNDIGSILTDLSVPTHALHHHCVESSVFARGSNILAIFVNGGSEHFANSLGFTVFLGKHYFCAN